MFGAGGLLLVGGGTMFFLSPAGAPQSAELQPQARGFVAGATGTF